MFNFESRKYINKGRYSMKNKVMLIILDGFGINENSEGNAIKNAQTPFLDELFENYPHNKIHTSGLHVGLPKGQMGNSEVGHVNIGAGRVVYQDSTRITKSISDGDFFENEIFLNAIKHTKKHNKKLHFMGLLSDGGVHSHQNHLYALLKLAKKENVNQAFIHLFMDGRDTAPTSGIKYAEQLEEKIKEIGIGKIASVGGRYFGMDRDKRWKRVSKGYDALIGRSEKHYTSAVKGISESYKANVNDEFIEPFFISENNQPVGKIEENDAIIFFNFRADRARQISRTLKSKDFDEFERYFLNPHLVQFTQYDADFPLPTAFPQISLDKILGEIISKKELSQLRCAETEKYAHITFFLNGGNDTIYKNEERILIKSSEVDTYDQRPEMSAREITDAVMTAMEKQKYEFIAINYANSDMVGHTGIYKAAITAVETLDLQLSKLIPFSKEQGYDIIVTADHGNSEQMIDYETNEPYTQHTTGPVPFLYIGEKYKKIIDDGKLSDIAPSILDLFGIEKPQQMTGHSLFK
jgi:2,3-bisphosphoglycerate-independent phosphoglycerate mutase